MLNLFDTYTTKGRDLHISMLLAGYKQPTVVINDDGWLPEDVSSPLQFFLAQAGAKFTGRPRFFNQIDLPRFWEVQADGNVGKIYDQNILRGQINYARRDNTRLVHDVEWYDQAGHVRLVEQYNRWGWKFAQTNRNQQGQALITTYLTEQGQAVLVANHVTGVITYQRPNGKVQVFKNRAALVAAYLRAADYDLDRIVFNSLGEPFLTLLELLPATKENFIFWQEPLGETVPGNMRYILDGHAGNTQVMVQERAVYQKLQRLIQPADQAKVHYLGYAYALKRLNQGRPVALILTYSDQIEHLSDLVQARPEVTFNVVATTEMSAKLMQLDRFANVHLYPTAKLTQIADLFKQADLYLDINHEAELLDADRQAFENSMLILAFQDTVHQPRYVAPAHRFAGDDWGQMSALIQRVLTDGPSLEQALQAQAQAADRALPKDYQTALG